MPVLAGSQRRFSTPSALSRQVAVPHRRFLDWFRSAASEYVSGWHARDRPVLIPFEAVEFLFLPLYSFSCRIATGLVTVSVRTFSTPLPKRVVLRAHARRVPL